MCVRVCFLSILMFFFYISDRRRRRRVCTYNRQVQIIIQDGARYRVVPKFAAPHSIHTISRRPDEKGDLDSVSRHPLCGLYNIVHGCTRVVISLLSPALLAHTPPSGLGSYYLFIVAVFTTTTTFYVCHSEFTFQNAQVSPAGSRDSRVRRVQVRLEVLCIKT